MFGQKVLLASALIFVLLVSGCFGELFGEKDRVSKIKDCIDLPTKQQQDQCFEGLKAGGAITEDDCEKLVGEYSQYRQRCLELFQEKSTNTSNHIDGAGDGLRVAGNLNFTVDDSKTFPTSYKTEYFSLKSPKDITIEYGKLSSEGLLEIMGSCEKNFCDAAQILAQVQLRRHLLESLRQSPEVAQLDCSYCDYRNLLEKVLESEALPDQFLESMRGVWSKLRSELENGFKARLKYASFDDFAEPFSASNVKLERIESGSFFSDFPGILYSDDDLSVKPLLDDVFYTNFNEVPFSESCGEYVFDLTMKYKDYLAGSSYISLQIKDKKELPEYCEVNLENLGNALNPLNTFVVTDTNETKQILEKVAVGFIPLTHVIKRDKLPSEKNFDDFDDVIRSFNDLRWSLINDSRITPRTIITVDAGSKINNIVVEKEFSDTFWIKIDATGREQAARLFEFVLKRGSEEPMLFSELSGLFVERFVPPFVEPACNSESCKVLVFVEEKIFGSLQPYLDTYSEDVKNELGFDVEIYHGEWESPERIKEVILENKDSVTGVLLVGKIPFVLFFKPSRMVSDVCYALKGTSGDFYYADIEESCKPLSQEIIEEIKSYYEEEYEGYDYLSKPFQRIEDEYVVLDEYQLPSGSVYYNLDTCTARIQENVVAIDPDSGEVTGNTSLMNLKWKNPKVWVGRLTAPTAWAQGTSEQEASEEERVDLLKRYFERNHLYRTGKLAFLNNGLVYDPLLEFREKPVDFIKEKYITGLNSMVSQNLFKPEEIELIRVSEEDDPLQKDAEYLEKLSKPYEIVVYNGHGSPDQHEENIFTGNIKQTEPKPGFYWLKSCNLCDFTSRNYIGGAYLFSGNGLVVYGCTDTCIFESEFLDNLFPLAAGMTFGDYFKESWGITRTLLGDPTLKLRYDVQEGKPKLSVDRNIIHFGKVQDKKSLLGKNSEEFIVKNEGNSALFFRATSDSVEFPPCEGCEGRKPDESYMTLEPGERQMIGFYFFRQFESLESYQAGEVYEKEIAIISNDPLNRISYVKVEAEFVE